MNISKIKGLKYPDEQFIKYFFKNNFPTKKNLKFIEFGCSNGNNLMLPYQYGFEVIGIDLDKISIDYANENFTKITGVNGDFNFHIKDMILFAQENKDIEADIFLLPNIVNYIKKDALITFLNMMIKNNNIKSGASFFMRCRTPKDFRFGIGERIEDNTYKLDKSFTITGEASCLNKFYTEYELVSMLKKNLNLRDFQVLHTECDTLHEQNTLVFNSDIVVWGTIN